MADCVGGGDGAASQDIQYHIEIEPGQSVNSGDGEVMLVLDLDGQELPPSVAQTIMQLAQSGGHPSNRSPLNKEVHVVYTDEKVDIPSHNQLVISNHEISSHMDGDHGYLQVVKQEELPALHDDASCVTLWQGSPADQVIVSSQTFNQLPQLVSPSSVSIHDENTLRINEHNTVVSTPSTFQTIRLGEGLESQTENVILNVKNEVLSLPDTAEVHGEVQVQASVTKELLNNHLRHKSTKTDTSSVRPQVKIHVEVLPKEISYLCQLCNFSSESDIALGKHSKLVHNLEKPYRCFKCEKSFEKELSLQIHSLCHESQPPIRKVKKGFHICPLCDFQCISVKRLERHFSLEHSNLVDSDSKPLSLLVCLLCRFSCVSQSELSQHKATSRHRRNERSKSVCPKCRQSCRNLEAHNRSVHSQDRLFLCTQCGYRANQQSVLNTHMSSHLEVSQHHCPTCQAAFKSSTQLQRHMKIHDSEKKYLCSQCPFSCHSNYEFKRHLQRVHTKRTVFACKHCEQTFLKARNLKLHAMSVHGSKDRHYCLYCDFSCEHSKTFRDHVQKHTDKNRFFCSQCDFTTPWQCRFKRHLNVHSTETKKTFACPVCDYSCWEKMNLKKHMVKHSTDRPYACDLCEQKCKMKHQLDEHKRVVHTSLRPYKCNFCNYTAKTPDNLKKHLWIHENIKPYKCPHCAYASREMSKVRRHADKKHKLISADALNQPLGVRTASQDVQVIQVFTAV